MSKRGPGAGLSAYERCVRFVWRAAKAAGAAGAGLEQRRAAFLKRVAELLGPTQLEHITAHSERVAEAAAGIARLLHLSPAEVERVRLAGLLHDIGKAAIPDDLLAKPGPLSKRERRLMDRHAEMGARICEALGADEVVVEMVRYHHARYDGDAGPAEGGRVPLGARVVCVADALVTMTSDRSYSKARSYTEALAELRRGRATLFDPQAVVAAHILGAEEMGAVESGRMAA